MNEFMSFPKLALSNETAETPSCFELENLFIIIHPLNERLGIEILDDDKTQKTREEFFNNCLNLFMPKSEKDAVVIVPNLPPNFHDLRIGVMNTISMMQLFNTPYSWVSMADAFEKKVNKKFQKNVILGDNIPDLNIPASKLESRILKHNLRITPETKIIFGGELAPNCVVDAVNDFFTLPQITKVYLDRRCIVGIADYVQLGDFIPEEVELTVARRLLPTHDVDFEGINYIKVT